jgi:proline iminopeptidase
MRKLSTMAVATIVLLVLPACGGGAGSAGGGWAQEDLTPRQGYVHVPGGRIWYQIVGTGHGTPLLTLHGGPGVPHYYLKPLAGVGVDRPVIFFDQLGAGRSDHVTDASLFTIPKYVERLDSLRHRLGLRQVHLYGQSWGTILGTEYVLAHPEGVRSLILSSPALDIPKWGADAKALVATLPDSMQEAIRIGDSTGDFQSAAYQAATQAYYQRYLARRQPWSADIDSAFAGMDTVQYYALNGHSEFTMDGDLKDYDITDSLPSLQLPVLYIAGQYDEARPATVRSFAAKTPDAVLSITPDAGHLTMQDDSAHDVRVIRSFLRRVDAAGSDSAADSSSPTASGASSASGRRAGATGATGRWTIPDSAACRGVTFGWSLPLERARELVGPGLEPAETSRGQSEVSVFGTTCPGGTVDGRTAGAAAIAALIVPVQAPSDSLGQSGVQQWAAIPEVVAPAGSPVAALFRRSGFHVTDGRVEIAPGDLSGGGKVTLTVTTGEGRFEGRATAPPASTAAATSVHSGLVGTAAGTVPFFGGVETPHRRNVTSPTIREEGAGWLSRLDLKGAPSSAFLDTDFTWDFAFSRQKR